MIIYEYKIHTYLLDQQADSLNPYLFGHKCNINLMTLCTTVTGKEVGTA